MEGGLGGSLIDGKWLHGESDDALSKVIAKGIPDAGMPAFGETLSPEMVRALVVFIREKEASARQSSAPAAPALAETSVRTMHGSHTTEVVLKDGLETPWALALLPDGRKLITERPGRLRVVDADWNLQEEPVVDTPAVVANGQGGLLEVAPAPDFESSGWVYLSYAAPDPTNKANAKSSMTKVSRGRLKGNTWADGQTIFVAQPDQYTTQGVHFGSRIVFVDGYLYFSIGDRGAADKAQEVGVPNGKIFRLLPDGGIPSDNPFVGRKGAVAAVWSYGHRNPQGLVVDSRDGSIYSTEHGPRGGDEFNKIRKGVNYGWPVVCFGMNYNGTPLTALTEKEGIEPPIHHWTPSIGTCGLAFYDGEAFPEWRYDFFAGGLRGGLHRLRLRDGKVVEDEVVLDPSVGRVRDVRCGPDGFIYVVLNSPDMIVRLVPAGKAGGQ